MVGGQAIDLDAVEPGSASRRSAAAARRRTACESMHARKTGALIRASVAAGAVMGGADDALFATLDRYGTEIGLAFQIVDDILDDEGVGGDARQDGGQGSRGRQADLSGVLRARAIARAGGRVPCRTRAQALESAGLLDSRLADIASWIIERKT